MPKAKTSTKGKPKPHPTASRAAIAKAKAAIPERRGRPLASEAHLSAERIQPWKKLKMSRRTYYRRKAAGTI